MSGEGRIDREGDGKDRGRSERVSQRSGGGEKDESEASYAEPAYAHVCVCRVYAAFTAVVSCLT